MNLAIQSKSQLQSAQFQYEAGVIGATGTYGLGIFIPKGSLIMRIHVLSFTVFNGASATISIGVKSVGSVVADAPAALLAAAVTTTYAAGTSTAANSEYWCSNTAVEVSATLGVAASTAGKLWLAVEYAEFYWNTN